MTLDIPPEQGRWVPLSEALAAWSSAGDAVPPKPPITILVQFTPEVEVRFEILDGDQGVLRVDLP